MVALFAFTFGLSARGQDLFGQQQQKDDPRTEEKKMADEKESIF